MSPRFLLFLLTLGVAQGGEYFRFDAKTGPGGRDGSCHGYAFDEKHEILRVVDREKPANTQSQTLGDAFASIGAAAGSSAGYSGTDGKPVGLVISDQKSISTLDTGAQAGGLLLVRNGQLALEKANGSTPPDLNGVTQAVQAGSLLVEDGKPAADLDTKTFSRRSVLVSSGTGQWAILYVPSATMDGLARMLADKTTFPRFPIARALTLGTGLSSSLWIARSDNALPLYLKEVDPVRGGIAILAKPR